VARTEGAGFDSASQCVVARLIDAAGGCAYLEHPFSSRAAEGTELLLQRLNSVPVCFVAGIMHARPHGLTVRPTSVVFTEGPARVLVQPWVDRAGSAPVAAGAAVNAAAASDEVGSYLRQLQEFLTDLYLSGLGRTDALTARAARDLARHGDRLGFARLCRPLAHLAAALDMKSKRVAWDWRDAGRHLLTQTVLLRLALDMS
jgi:hypothetical protein